MEEILMKLQDELAKEIVAVNIGLNVNKGVNPVRHAEYKGMKRALEVVMDIIKDLA